MQKSNVLYLTLSLTTILTVNSFVVQANPVTPKATQPPLLTHQPQKIIVMDYGELDTLDAVGATHRINGIPQGNPPTYLQQDRQQQYIDTGSLKKIKFEAIRQAKPDLNISKPRQKADYAALEDIAPTYHPSLNAKQ